MHSRVLTLLFALALRNFSTTAGALAQDHDAAAGPVAPGWDFGAWAGAGVSVVVHPLGGVPNRQLYVGGVFASRRLAGGRRLALSYFVEWLPLAVSTRTPRSPGVWLYSWGRFDSLYAPGSDRRGPVPGTGIVPLGLRASASLGPSLVAFGEAAGGVVGFTSNVPDLQSRRLNFLGVAGVGIRSSRRARTALLGGYRFMHLSNAHTARRNPGLNIHLLYVGVAIR